MLVRMYVLNQASLPYFFLNLTGGVRGSFHVQSSIGFPFHMAMKRTSQS
jgi:hypothetical protein